MNSPLNTIRPESDRLKVVISLGANLDSSLGPPDKTIMAAITRLRRFTTGRFSASSLYTTSPVDCPPGTPEFVNAVVVLELATDSDPAEFLSALQNLETEYGRTPSSQRNESRPLDLDLIAFGPLISSAPELVLPHPRSHERRFVLEPLVELDPDYRLPGQQETVARLLAGLQNSG